MSEETQDSLSDEQIWQHIQDRAPTPAMRVALTDDALRQALELAKEPAHTGKPLRVYVEGKGCDGFYYGVSFDDRAEADLVFPHAGLDVIVDPESLRFVFGAEVQWVDDERGRGFLVENPHHKRFRGKFYKRKSWLDLLTSSSAQ